MTNCFKKREKNKKAQVTLFVIMGILIVVGIAGFFIYRGVFSTKGVSNEFKPVYDYYENCILSIVEEGKDILSSRGGYININSFEAGSQYMPTSSELNLYGNPVPYWFYRSGNNLLREKVPTKNQMEMELTKYVEENLKRCDFKEIEEKGYLVDYSEGKVNIKILNEKIEVSIKQDIRAVKGEKSAVYSEHKFSLNSHLGKMFSVAKDIYNYQKNNSFLESYTLDILYNYAPVTGVELTCSPIFFNKQEIRKNLTEAIANNIQYINLKGKKNNYFSRDIGSKLNENVIFLYSKEWPTKIEIYGDDVAQPVGGGKGLEILGFCYTPYHFVYDIVYPVLVQIYDEKEMFQFAIVVIIDRNQPREAVFKDDYYGEDLDICKNSVNDLFIKTTDLYGKPVEAFVRIGCVNSGCSLGKTKLVGNIAILNTKAPPCVNAVIEATAEGYLDGKKIVSTNEENNAEIILKKKYPIKLNLGNIQGKAIVRFEGEDYSYSLNYPERDSLELVEGFYNVSVFVFKNSSLTLPSYIEKKCVDVPSTGIRGLFGKEEKKCFDIKIPEQKIESVLIGGGTTLDYFSEEDFIKNSKMFITAPLFKEPTSLEEISENYIKLENSIIEISFGK